MSGLDETRDYHNNHAGAIILAGGDSKRLGRPKALLDFHGRTLIKIVVERLKSHFHCLTLVTDRPDLYRGLPVRLVGDILVGPKKSPLRGIHAGLSTSDLPYQFVAACDMPFLNLDLIKYMAGFIAGYDAVVPRIGDYYQPLHAFYRRSCIKTIEKQLERERYKVTDFYANLKTRYIGPEEIFRFDPDQESFFNINTFSDYNQALEIFVGRLETG